jgi:hypothetical protein
MKQKGERQIPEIQEARNSNNDRKDRKKEVYKEDGWKERV